MQPVVHIFVAKYRYLAVKNLINACMNNQPAWFGESVVYYLVVELFDFVVLNLVGFQCMQLKCNLLSCKC
jgi:hypothetical protein